MLAARLVLALLAVACLIRLALLEPSRDITTDVLDLLPADERAPELSLVRGLTADVQARVVLLALADPNSEAPPDDRAAAALIDSLRRSEAFTTVERHGDPAQREAFGRAIFERRFTLLLPAWLDRMQRAFAESSRPENEFPGWAAERAADELESFLAQPEAMSMHELIAADPLLLVPRLVRDLAPLEPLNSISKSRVLVWALQKAPPLSDAGQEPVFAAIEKALADARAIQPALTLEWTGINRFAATSRSRIQREVTLLNIASIVAVLGVATIFLRRPWQIIQLLPVVLLSLLGAWTATTLVFPSVHILVFVIGALLAGVAIDYGFYVALQPPDPRNPSYSARLRPLLRPLLTSCLTTVVGFSLLLGSELPLLRQVGFFVASGVLCAFGAALLWFAAVPTAPLATRSVASLDRGRFTSRRVPLVLLVLAFVCAAALPFVSEWRDDIRELDVPSPDLRQTDARVRQLFGERSGQTAYLTFGHTLADARKHLDQFLRHINSAAPSASLASLGAIFPTESSWRAAPQTLEKLASFPAAFRAELERRTFDSSAFTPFFNAWNEISLNQPPDDYARIYRDLAPHLPAPLAQTFAPFAPRPWFLTLVQDASELTVPRELSTIAVHQLETFNTLFGRYRISAVRLSFVGLALVVLVVTLLYRDRRAFRIAAVPAGACFATLGLLSILGLPLNLFHLLGGFLGACLAHDYTIFTSATTRARALPPTAVRLSALTTVASFVVLGFSRIPVIHALGTTVALVVSIALIALEIEARTPRRS